MLRCYCHKICRVQAAGLKNSNFTKTYDACEYVKFGAISLKNGRMPKTACAHISVTHITVIFSGTTNSVSTKSIFSSIQSFLPNFCGFYRKITERCSNIGFPRQCFQKVANIRRLLGNSTIWPMAKCIHL